jgi:O-succinylbenzoic acid--CoA ligase
METKNFSFLELSRKHTNNSAFITSEYDITYAELPKQIFHLVDILRQSGVKTNNRVALLCSTNLQYTLLLLALFQIGATAVPLNIYNSEQQTLKQIKSINCSKLLISEEFKNPGLKKHANLIEIKKIGSSLRHMKPSVLNDPIPLQNEATIMFTSGTSDTPKAVLHKFGNHYYSALGSNLNIPLAHSDRWLLSLPLYHVAGIAIIFRTLLAGASTVIPDDDSTLLENVVKYKITHLSLVATQFARILDEAQLSGSLKGIKAILLGGSAISFYLIEKAIKYKLPIHVSYGSTEMASQITTTTALNEKNKLETSGKVLKYREIKVSADGEILVKGHTLFKGYLKKTGIDLKLDQEGWFCTGDLGELDRSGYLTVKGRKDNMFISGGENIYPEEIECQLLQLEGISEAIVVDVPDERFGARPVAFIKFSKDAKIGADEIRKHLARKIHKFKIPVCFFSWPQKTFKIKPNRQVFKQLALKKLETNVINS